MNGMIERVARAIYYGDGVSVPYDVGDNAFEADINGAAYCRRMARAAIEEMRDYSEEMSQVGGAVSRAQYGDPMPVGQSIAERCYLAMIDAALKDSP